MRGPSIKRRIITILRIVNTGIHNLLRNAWLTTAAIAVMTVTLTIVASAFVANFAFQEAIESVAKNLTISVYLEDDSSDQAQAELRARIEANQYVERVDYKSKEEALQDFQSSFSDRPELLEGLAIAEGNVFPASFEIVMSDINQYQEIVTIAGNDEFDEVVLQTSDNELSRESFNRFISAQRTMNRASIILGAIFGSISILIIFNTIRMAIFTRSDEIEIMKLIGATPSYIRGPYLVEASMYGVIAGIISIGVFYPTTVRFASDFLAGVASDFGTLQTTSEDSLFPEGIVTFLSESWPLVFAVVIGAGILLGFLSAAFAMSRYLRLKRW